MLIGLPTAGAGARAMVLERERQTFESNLKDLLRDRGKYVVIHQDDIIGTFDTYEDALKVGYMTAGLEPFLVKQILEKEPVVFLPPGARIPCPS
jgi:hypothetical protein